MDGSLPGSSIHGIFQARVLEWGALPSPTTTLEELRKKPWEEGSDLNQLASQVILMHTHIWEWSVSAGLDNSVTIISSYN